ncbi:hypothetical protein M413DRAFT_430359 [Hebeloma cylindrosporum]|uniref:Uncharacterized protein n=1 Tax=Hebeloma cylindrosporum TaxID=76867 RepID=A0A0C3CNL4_HEBCY|nr:hypothetical protein M413DRAFT_430359 [Hebeloma cylindrosporum h7]
MAPGQYRLFITLQVRSPGNPGYHFSLLLSPKIERKSERRSIRFHATNNITKTHRPDENGYVRWRYEKSAVDPHASQHLVTKILVAKLSSAKKSVTYWMERIDQVLERVPVVQRQDASRFNCNIWVR